jgi:hypothetical protein
MRKVPNTNEGASGKGWTGKPLSPSQTRMRNILESEGSQDVKHLMEKMGLSKTTIYNIISSFGPDGEVSLDKQTHQVFLKESFDDRVRKFITGSSVRPTLSDTAIHMGKPPDDQNLKEAFYRHAKDWQPPTNPVFP